MNNEELITKQQVQTDSTQLQTTTKSSNVSLQKIQTLEDAEKFAEYIAKSPTYNARFVKERETEDGKTEKYVETGDIITCLVLGAELGFTPMKSIVLGSKLNRSAVIKIEKGKALGISPMSALSDVYIFDEGKDSVYVGIGIIEQLLLAENVKQELIEDFVQIVKHIGIDTSIKDEEVEFDSEKYICINGLKPDQIKNLISKSPDKLLVKKTLDYRTTVKLTRIKDGNEHTIAIPYTLQDAIDAELYPGTTREGIQVTGKDNWKKHTRVMLRKMSVMLGARKIIGDRLHGVYLADELPNVNIEVTDTTYEEL